MQTLTIVALTTICLKIGAQVLFFSPSYLSSRSPNGSTLSRIGDCPSRKETGFNKSSVRRQLRGQEQFNILDLRILGMPAALLSPNNVSLIHNDNSINICLIPQTELLLISSEGIFKIIKATIYQVLTHTAVALGTLPGLFYKYMLTTYYVCARHCSTWEGYNNEQNKMSVFINITFQCKHLCN